MTTPYPATATSRQRERIRIANQGATRGRIAALALVMSLKCSGNEGRSLWLHAGTPNGCANDGSTCLCECHDRPPEEDTA